MTEYLAAVDIGGTNIRASVASIDGIHSKVKQDVMRVGDENTVPRQVDNLIAEACKDAGIDKKRISGVGISTCGPFDDNPRGKYELVVAPNICEGIARKEGRNNDWTGFPLRDYLSQSYERVEAGNDCTTAVNAEHMFGAGRGYDVVAYMTISTGIGGGVKSHGKLVLGRRNAGHFGHHKVVPNGRICGCGIRGHLEAHAAGPAIAAIYEEIMNRKIEVVDPKDKPKYVFDQFRRGDFVARRVISEAAGYIAQTLANVSADHDVQAFIFGGSMWNDKDVLQPLIEERFAECVHPTLGKDVAFKTAELEDRLGDIAALTMVLPADWVGAWQKTQPWQKPLETRVIKD
jgi:glucokinase